MDYSFTGDDIYWVFITKEFDLFSRIKSWVILGDIHSAGPSRIESWVILGDIHSAGPCWWYDIRAIAGFPLLMRLVFVTVIAYAYLLVEEVSQREINYS